MWELYILDLKTKVLERKKNQLHFSMDIAKIVLIVWPELPQMPEKIPAQFVCPSPKVSNLLKRSSLWVSVVRVFKVHKR